MAIGIEKTIPIMWFLAIGLLLLSQIAMATTTNDDQKNYYSPDPHHASPSHGSPSHHHHGGGGTSPSHGSGGGGASPSHGGGGGSGASPSHGGSGGYGGPPSHSTPSDPSTGNCGTPPSSSVPTPSTPPSGGGGYYPNPPSSGGSPPSTPTTPTPSTPPYVPTPSTPTTPYVPTPSTPTTPNLPPFVPVDPNSPFSCNYWRNHPGIVWGLVGWWGTVGNAFGVNSLPGFGGTSTSSTTAITLQQLLTNTRTDGYGTLYREGTASLLNSMVTHKFPFTTMQVRDRFISSLSSNKAAAVQGHLFKMANDGKLKLSN